MFTLGIVLYALARFHSPAVAGWLSFASIAPGLVISPITGALLDRIGSRWAIAINMLVSSILVTAVVVVDLLGCSSTTMLLVLVALFSLTSPLSAAGVRALLPRLVPASEVVGPAAAGALAYLAGPTQALIVISLIYSLAVIAIRVSPSPQAFPRDETSLMRQALAGLVRVCGQPTLRGLAVSYSLYQATWGILVVAVPVFSARTFTSGKADLASGLLWACVGVAGGVGALMAGHFRTAGRERNVMMVAMLVTAPAVVAALFGLTWITVGLMVAGTLTGPIDVGVLTLRQRRTDPAELGRVLSVSMSLNMAGFPIGTALAGVLLLWSVPSAFFAAAFTSILAAIAAAALIPTHDEAGSLDPASIRTSDASGSRPF
jgi:MFS family permease